MKADGLEGEKADIEQKLTAAEAEFKRQHEDEARCHVAVERNLRQVLTPLKEMQDAMGGPVSCRNDAGESKGCVCTCNLTMQYTATLLVAHHSETANAPTSTVWTNDGLTHSVRLSHTFPVCAADDAECPPDVCCSGRDATILHNAGGCAEPAV